MESVISFRLKDGESWDVDDTLADIKILLPQLILTTHDYYETQRQFHFLVARTCKKSRRTEFSPDGLNDLINRENEREAKLGPCKGFEIVCENYMLKGTINERGGLRFIGKFSPKDQWARKLIEYLNNLANKGELKVDQ